MRLLPLAALVLAGASAAYAQSPADWLSGVDLTRQDARVRPGDDFFRYTLGSWYAKDDSPCELLRNSDAWGAMLGARRFNIDSLTAIRCILNC